MASLDVTGVLAGVPVRDMDVAVGWYTALFGRRPDARPMPSLADWTVGGGATVQVVHDPARAGGGLLTLQVDDLDDICSVLMRRGVELARHEGSDLVRIGSISDPDGNGLTLIEARDGFDPHAAPAQP